MALRVTQDCNCNTTACFRCMDVCQYGAISLGWSRPEIDKDKCTECGACREVCPTAAIW